MYKVQLDGIVVTTSKPVINQAYTVNKSRGQVNAQDHASASILCYMRLKQLPHSAYKAPESIVPLGERLQTWTKILQLRGTSCHCTQRQVLCRKNHQQQACGHSASHCSTGTPMSPGKPSTCTSPPDQVILSPAQYEGVLHAPVYLLSATTCTPSWNSR